MIKLINIMILALMMSVTTSASAEEVIMYRVNKNFIDTMTLLQNSVIEHQYTLSRVQRVDIGLNKAGYKTDRYRIVFFGKHEEYKTIFEKYPEMTAYIPLRIVIYAEGEDTMMVAMNPLHYSDIVSNKEMSTLYKRWNNDIRSIMSEVRQEE